MTTAATTPTRLPAPSPCWTGAAPSSPCHRAQLLDTVCQLRQRHGDIVDAARLQLCLQLAQEGRRSGQRMRIEGCCVRWAEFGVEAAGCVRGGCRLQAGGGRGRRRRRTRRSGAVSFWRLVGEPACSSFLMLCTQQQGAGLRLSMVCGARQVACLLARSRQAEGPVPHPAQGRPAELQAAHLRAQSAVLARHFDPAAF